MKRRTLIAFLLSPVVLLLAVLTYLIVMGPGLFKPLVEKAVSRAIGRNITISGKLEARIGWTTNVIAESIRIDNVEWSSEPAMVQVDHLSVAFSTRSLIFGPVILEDIAVLGARVYLEMDREKGPNWKFGRDKQPKPAAASMSPVILKALRLKDVHITYEDRSRGKSAGELLIVNALLRRLEDNTYQLQDFLVNQANDHLKANGVVGRFSDLVGTDLTIEGSGPDFAPFGVPFGIFFPPEPYIIKGRLERSEAGYGFHDILAKVGDYRGALNGTLGNLPRFLGTDIDVQLKGPDLSPFSQISGFPKFPKQAFEVSGHLYGDPSQFKSNRFTVRLGKSDLSGSFRVDLKAKTPRLTGDVKSKHIDLSALKPEKPEDVGSFKENGGVEAKDEAGSSKKKLLISDDPMKFEFLRKLDGKLKLTAENVEGDSIEISDLEIALNLEGGVLSLEKAKGRHGADQTFEAELKLEPSAAGDGCRVYAKLKGSRLRLSLFAGEVEKRPPLDFSLEFDGAGRSLRELLLYGRGDLNAKLSEGIIKSPISDFLTWELLSTIFKALNPISKKKKETKMHCAVAGLKLSGGIVRLDALAVRTDALTVVGGGKLEIKDEKIDFSWAAKPRKGIGLSTGSITDPYVKLGGTLAKPSLEVKPLSSVLSTGATVTTLGFYIVAKGFWDRINAEKNVCRAAEKKLSKRKEDLPDSR